MNKRLWRCVRDESGFVVPWWIRWCATLAFTLVPLAVVAAPASTPRHTEVDAALAQVFTHLQARRIDQALTELDQLIAKYPNFRLAHFVRGDLLLARSRPIAAFGHTSLGRGDKVQELRAEATARIRGYRERPPADLVPRYLLHASPRQTHAIIVDGDRSRVYLYQMSDAGPRLVKDYYATLGRSGIHKVREGDRKTPVGVYHVTSHIPGAKLPDLYGWGAFPINYPNDWDRLARRTGSGIWLHGVPSDNYSRAPRASDGCIALPNSDMAELARHVQAGTTPVIIAERVEWTAPAALQREREAFLRHLEKWRTDWESRDTDRYLGHYSRSFRSDGMDIEGWRAHKRKVNSGKEWIKVVLADVSVYRSPGAQNLISVTFDQDYRSSNLSDRSRKRQYWMLEEGRWRIVYEASVTATPIALPESFPGQRVEAPVDAGRRQNIIQTSTRARSTPAQGAGAPTKPQR